MEWIERSYYISVWQKVWFFLFVNGVEYKRTGEEGVGDERIVHARILIDQETFLRMDAYVWNDDESALRRENQ